MKILERFKLWARLAPLPEGRIPDGDERTALRLGENGAAVLVMFDSNGRVFQILGARIEGGLFRQVSDGRSATIAMLDRFDVQDYPEMESGL